MWIPHYIDTEWYQKKTIPDLHWSLQGSRMLCDESSKVVHIYIYRGGDGAEESRLRSTLWKTYITKALFMMRSRLLNPMVLHMVIELVCLRPSPVMIAFCSILLCKNQVHLENRWWWGKCLWSRQIHVSTVSLLMLTGWSSDYCGGRFDCCSSRIS